MTHLVEESTDVATATRVKIFGGLIGLKSKTFAAHGVTGADFAAARASAAQRKQGCPPLRRGR